MCVRAKQCALGALALVLPVGFRGLLELPAKESFYDYFCSLPPKGAEHSSHGMGAGCSTVVRRGERLFHTIFTYARPILGTVLAGLRQAVRQRFLFLLLLFCRGELLRNV